MIHLRCAPWLLLVAAVSLGCPHRNETKPDAASPVGSSSAALEGAPLETDGALPAEAEAGHAGDGDKGSGAQDAGELEGSRGQDAGQTQAGEEACVDAWLEARGMDRYGSPKGTMYMGGTPLFDERTGERTDRLVFVYRRHGEARAACRPDGGVPAAPGGPATE